MGTEEGKTLEVKGRLKEGSAGREASAEPVGRYQVF
jgi:hypothetical protein